MGLKKLPIYLLALAGVVMLIYVIGVFKNEQSPTPISSDASIPNYALQNARIYLIDGEHSRSLENVKEAIESLEYLHKQAQGTARKKLETGLNSLKGVAQEMENGRYDSEKLNQSSVTVHNSLIYYEICSAKTFIQNDQRPKAMEAVSMGIQHLRNALDFAKGNRKEYEVGVFSEMDQIKSNYYMDEDSMVEVLDSILVELKDLELAYNQ